MGEERGTFKGKVVSLGLRHHTLEDSPSERVRLSNEAERDAMADA